MNNKENKKIRLKKIQDRKKLIELEIAALEKELASVNRRKSAVASAMARCVKLTVFIFFLSPALSFAQSEAESIMEDSPIEINISAAKMHPWLVEVTLAEWNEFAKAKDDFVQIYASAEDTYESIAKSFGRSEGFVRLYQCPDLEKPMGELSDMQLYVLPAYWFDKALNESK